MDIKDIKLLLLFLIKILIKKLTSSMNDFIYFMNK